jgi:hypothetical protein
MKFARSGLSFMLQFNSIKNNWQGKGSNSIELKKLIGMFKDLFYVDCHQVRDKKHFNLAHELLWILEHYALFLAAE